MQVQRQELLVGCSAAHDCLVVVLCAAVEGFLQQAQGWVGLFALSEPGSLLHQQNSTWIGARFHGQVRLPQLQPPRWALTRTANAALGNPEALQLQFCRCISQVWNSSAVLRLVSYCNICLLVRLGPGAFSGLPWALMNTRV